jgi:esterase/lipase superfamily enzyme
MKNSRRLFLFAALLLAAASGFFVSELMHRPPSFDLGEIEFPNALRESANMPVIEVLFVTNRKPVEGKSKADAVFGNDNDNELHYGRAEVRIPATFSIGDTQNPEIPREMINEELAIVEKAEIISEPEFRALLAQRMAGQEQDGATVFVHGIATSLDSSLRLAGALQFSLNLRQPMILFSWPTQPSLSIDSYRRSQEQVDASAAALEKFLEPYRQSRFDLLAYSLGCKVVCRTFDLLMKNDLWCKTETELPNVILAAPDVDPKDFDRAFVGELGALADRTTVYVARNDHALVISELLNNRPRLGAAVTPETAVTQLVDQNAGDNSRVEIVDATFVNNARISHRYFYQSRAVFSDLYNLLRNNLPARERQLLQHQRAREANYWIIPP